MCSCLVFAVSFLSSILCVHVAIKYQQRIDDFFLLLHNTMFGLFFFLHDVKSQLVSIIFRLIHRVIYH